MLGLGKLGKSIIERICKVKRDEWRLGCGSVGGGGLGIGKLLRGYGYKSVGIGIWWLLRCHWRSDGKIIGVE